jgi:photosystem II stability/assembly factor-like uncharacterized protein
MDYIKLSVGIKVTDLRQRIILRAAFFLTVLTFNNSYAQVLPSSGKERLLSLEKASKLSNSSLLKDVKFRNVGPSLMSGRVVDIDVNPRDPKEFYVAYATGGLWYTKTNGHSLVPIFDKQHVIGIGDIAVNWDKDIIWVGTGEANSSRSSYAGIGMYKSTDKGKTWNYLGLPESHHIGKVQLHPSDDNTAWVAVIGHLFSNNKDRGVYKTTDGGNTWKQTLYIDERTGAIDIDINLKDPRELYAAMWHRERTAWNLVEGGSTSGIYKSNDGGNTWKLISGGKSGFPKHENVGRIGVAVHQNNPNILYAALDNQTRRPDTAAVKKDSTAYNWRDLRNLTKEQFLKLDDKKLDTFLKKNDFPTKYTAAGVKQSVQRDELKTDVLYQYLLDGNAELGKPPVVGCEIYRSDDAGATWKKVNEKGLSIYNTFGYYFGKIAVSRSNPDKVIVGGIELLLSVDGGKTFNMTGRRLTHADWHRVWMNPQDDKHWIGGNDGGCNITYDDGQNWFKANTPAVGQFYAVEVDDAKPYNIYGGLQDNGTWYGTSKPDTTDNYSDLKPGEWKKLNVGDGMQVQVDTRDNKTVYTGYQFGIYGRTTVDQPGGRRIFPKPDFGTSYFRYNWQVPIHLSRHNQDILYYGTNHFHRSMNRGDSMQVISQDLTNGRREGDVPFGTLTTISESPIRFGIIYSGTDDGRIQFTKDGGYTWTLVNKKFGNGLYVSRVVASKYKLGRVYVTLNGFRNDHFTPYLFVSEDFGESWTRLGEDLPAEPLNVVREDQKFENIIYVGSDNGVYASLNRGKNFMVMDTSLPRVPVHDMVIQKTANDLVLGTHGRSIYIASLDKVHNLFKAQQDKNKKTTALQTFDWRKMNDDELDIDCPPAKAKKRSKKKDMVYIDYDVKN